MAAARRYCGGVHLRSSRYRIFAALLDPLSVHKVKSLGANSFIVSMPRYQKFTDAAGRLMRAQVRFVEIAGNQQITVTAVVSRDWTFRLPAGELLFSSEILTDRLSKRVVLRVPVAQLGAIFENLPIEHIYDF